MKRIILSIFLFFTFLAFSQQKTIHSNFNANDIAKEAKTGHFQWVFPTETSAEEIQNTAKYYTTSFTVNFNAESKVVDLFPVVDSEDTRRVMLRFLGANQVNKILVGTEEFLLWEYYDKFMKFN